MTPSFELMSCLFGTARRCEDAGFEVAVAECGVLYLPGLDAGCTVGIVDFRLSISSCSWQYQ